MPQQQPETERADVCIIGAGWSGLLAAHHMTEQGLSVLLLERRDGLGGVWRFSPDPDVVTVMKSTITSSSAAVTEASDFPMDDSMGYFVHHEEVLDWLERYADHWDLRRHVRFQRSVESVQRTVDGWTVSGDGFVVESRFLVVSAGLHQRRKAPGGWMAEFGGTMQHVGSIKSIPPDTYGPDDHVLVYGGGESAADVVEQLTHTGARITWSIPNGQHFFRKAAWTDRKGPGRYERTDSPLDEACSRAIQLVSPFHRSKPGMKWLCMIGSTGSPMDYEGHGLPQWHKGVPFMRAFINKNGHVIEFVREGRVTAEGPVSGADGKVVRFASGKEEEFTHLIACTGYQAAFPFLPDDLQQDCVEDRFKMIFDPDEPDLAFIGYARPTVGSLPLVSEIQAFWVSRVFAGKVALPSSDAMRAGVRDDKAARDEFFHHRRRPPGLVHIIDYGHEVAELAGVRPHYGKLFLRSPVAWWKTFFAPATAAQFRLVDPERRRDATAQIWRRTRKRYYLYPWLYLVARVLQVDPLLDRLHARRRQKQAGGAEAPPTREAAFGAG